MLKSGKFTPATSCRRGIRMRACWQCKSEKCVFSVVMPLHVGGWCHSLGPWIDAVHLPHRCQARSNRFDWSILWAFEQFAHLRGAPSWPLCYTGTACFLLIADYYTRGPHGIYPLPACHTNRRQRVATPNRVARLVCRSSSRSGHVAFVMACARVLDMRVVFFEILHCVRRVSIVPLWLAIFGTSCPPGRK